jgi:YHS domain-containing protein
MRSRVLRITKLLSLVVIALAMLIVVGCKKSSTSSQTAGIEQITCPVMAGNPIDKNVFVEYQGKKVYFCCPECKAKFQADPEKYLDKLPQFKEQAEKTMEKASDEMKEAAENMPDM